MTTPMTTPAEPSPKPQVQHWAAGLMPHLAPQSRTRLNWLIALMDDEGWINYAAAYAELFPDSFDDAAAKTRADKAFSNFRRNLAVVADEHGMLFELQVDQRKKAKPEHRRLWFVTADDSEARITGFNQAQILDLPEHLADQPISEQSERAQRHYLLLYAKKDQDIALQLHETLAEQFVVQDLDWRHLDWHDIPPGANPAEERKAMGRQAQAVIALLSPSLIADLKQGAIEPPPKLPLIPLALRSVQPDHLRDTAFADLEVFRDQGQDAWHATRGPKRDAWISAAAEQIGRRLRMQGAEHAKDLARLLRPRIREQDCTQDQYIHQLIDDRAPERGRRQDPSPEAKTALPYLLDWLRNPQADVFCAIFGELGMGKTTLCQRLTAELLRLRAEGEPSLDQAPPLPLYLDLRAIHDMPWDWQTGAPSLEAMLEHLIRTGHELPEGQPPPDADQIKALVRKQRGLILFDGLDEVMNRLTPEQNRQFIRALWEVLPPTLWKAPRNAPQGWRRPAGVGRLIMTCRSHFFPHLQAQLSALDGQQREQVSAKDYLWLTLLPFRKAQIEQYFHQVFADDPDKAERVIRMLDEVHDLRELGSRPYNLRLIQAQVDDLEAKRRAGQRVDIADLYEGLVGQWLHRDDPKHRLKREHKLILMERLAHRLWAGQAADLPYAELDDWLLDQMAADRRWRDIEYFSYRARDGGMAILQDDLRNASFLVREGADRFRFAHTSIMEFFLARALHQALVAAGDARAPDPDRLADWAIPRPSAETLDFLGGLIQQRDTDACLRGLDQIRSRYQKWASELALAYALHAKKQELPGAEFADFHLEGADLPFQIWRADEGATLNFRRSSFARSTLSGGSFYGCNFEDALFEKTDLTRCVFEGCRFNRAAIHKARLTGATFRDCSGIPSVISESDTYHTEFLGSETSGNGKSGTAAPPKVFTRGTEKADPRFQPEVLAGHTGSVLSIASSIDGRLLASAGNDGCLYLWDCASGRPIHRLRSQDGPIRAIAFDHTGELLASGGDGPTIRVWSTASGRLEKSFHTGEDWIFGLAFDIHGNCLAAGSNAERGGSAHIWASDSGQLLSRATVPVFALRHSSVDPDGQHYAFGGDGGNLLIMDKKGHKWRHAIFTNSPAIVSLTLGRDGSTNRAWLLAAERNGTLALADIAANRSIWAHRERNREFSVAAVDQDCRWIASAGNGTIQVWEFRTGRAIGTLKGPNEAIGSLAFYKDSKSGDPRLASAGGGGVLRVWDPVRLNLVDEYYGHTGWINGLATACDGSWIASAGEDQAVRFWDLFKHRIAYSSPTQSAIHSAAIDCSGTYLSTGHSDGTICIWDIQAKAIARQLKDHRQWVGSMVYDQSGEYLFSGGMDVALRKWNISTGSIEWSHDGHRSSLDSIAIDPKGRWIASGGSSTKLVFQHPDFGIVREGSEHGLSDGRNMTRALAADPNGAWVAAAGNYGVVRLVMPNMRAFHKELTGAPSLVRSMVVDPGGEWLAASGADAMIQIWSLATFLPTWQLHAGRRPVTCLATHHEGAWLAAGVSGGVLQIWNPKTGKMIREWNAKHPNITALAVDPKGHWLASCGSDAVVRLWTTDGDSACWYCGTSFELLPEGNWVAWQDPDGPNRRWINHSPGAWRWLGWHAPLPDGKRWMFHPMDAFRAPEPAPQDL